ncbi:hypothetical protein Glove_26g178 [Diversispora epigaea]|uniref:Uncharacterized protein n=1 Tax=Diversispora epigaea TaxID=1348612 RepID=A0A397JI20_9GLOM|nr:hypothetical protein Glove_26g178 [Diversispora epigaea]
MSTTFLKMENNFGVRSQSVNAKLCEIHNDIDFIELELPQIKNKGKKHDKIFEAIHNIFDAEIIDNKLFIKDVVNSLNQQLPTWWNQIDTKCVVNGNQYRPDADSWNTKPTLNQRRAPIINSIPPSLLWVEVTYDKTDNCDNVINKILRVQPYCPNTEFVIIVVPVTGPPFPANLNSGVGSTTITPKMARSFRAPYLGHWSVGNAVRWYKMKWNKHNVERTYISMIYFKP